MTTLDDTLDTLKKLIDKVKKYNDSVIKLNDVLLYQQTYGDLFSTGLVKKSIDFLISTDYYGFFEKNISPIDNCDEIINFEKQYNERKDKKKFNYNSVCSYFDDEFKEEYERCINKNDINNIDYIELLIKILMIKIDSILDFTVSVELEEKYIRKEIVRLHNELSLIVNNKHKNIKRVSSSERISKRNELINIINIKLNEYDLKKYAVDLLKKYTEEDLKCFYNVYRKLCLFENEIISKREDNKEKYNSDPNKLKKLIATVESYKLSDDELSILSLLIEPSISDEIKVSMKSYRPIELNIKINEKRKIL